MKVDDEVVDRISDTSWWLRDMTEEQRARFFRALRDIYCLKCGRTREQEPCICERKE